MSDQWYFQVMGQVYGPLTGQQLKQQAAAGVVQRDTLVRRGDEKWGQAWQVKGLLNAAMPPVLPTASQVTQNTQPASKDNIPADTTAKKSNGMRFRYYWNAWQLSAFACWLIGGLMILIPVFVVRQGMQSQGSDFGMGTAKTIIAVMCLGVVFLAAGGTLHKIGTGKYR